MISSPAFSMRAAQGMTALAEFFGPFYFRHRGKACWKIAQDIGTAWLLTIPIAALLAVGVYRLLGPPFAKMISPIVFYLRNRLYCLPLLVSCKRRLCV
jgi:phosphate/sulfate permease